MPDRSSSRRSQSPLQRRGPGRPRIETVWCHGRVFTALNELWTERYLTPSQLWRGLLAKECCSITFDGLLTGQGKATPGTLKAVAILGHALGLPEDQILVGKIVPAPPAHELIDRLERLEQQIGTTFTSEWVQQRIAAIRAAEGALA